MWAQDDPGAAVDWAATQSTELEDTALTGAARALRYREPEAAMAYASAVSDPKTRVSTMDSVARHWMRSDPEAAVIYVLESDLPDGVKRKYAQRAIAAQNKQDQKQTK
jgi:hypothetical protein